LVIYLGRQIDYPHFLRLAKNIPLRFFFGLFALFLLLNIFRALRFRMLLGRKELPLGILFPITLCHNFFVRTLPLMVGEFSYIALLRRHLKIPVSEGIRSLFEARLFDLQFVIVGGTFGLLTMGVQFTGYVLSILVLAGGLIIANRVLFSVLPKGIERIWTCIIRIYPWHHTALLDSAGHKLGEVSLQLDRFRGPRPLLKALTFSLCTYGLNVSCHLLFLSTLDVNQRLSVLLVVISIVMVAAWFPFSLSGFGVIEGSWAGSLVMFTDMEVGSALSVGFFIHCCQVLMTALLGLLGFVLLTPQVSVRLMSACNQIQKRVSTS
jgi:uncharacterized membrane protein YbhN (UPF0104 family)